MSVFFVPHVLIPLMLLHGMIQQSTHDSFRDTFVDTRFNAEKRFGNFIFDD